MMILCVVYMNERIRSRLILSHAGKENWLLVCDAINVKW